MSAVDKMRPIFGTECLRFKRMLPISPFILSSPFIHQSQPASTCALCCLLSLSCSLPLPLTNPPPSLPSVTSHDSQTKLFRLRSLLTCGLLSEVQMLTVAQHQNHEFLGSAFRDISQHEVMFRFTEGMNAAAVWCV